MKLHVFVKGHNIAFKKLSKSHIINIVVHSEAGCYPYFDKYRIPRKAKIHFLLQDTVSILGFV